MAPKRLRRGTAFALIVVAAAGVAAWAAAFARRDSATDVRTAVVAASAYGDAHAGSYVGMTVKKLRRWVNVKNIRVVRATRRAYCIENITGRRVNFDGPNGKLRYGPCGTRGAVVPAARPPAPRTQPDWEKRLRKAGIAAMAYYADHGSYARMTLAAMKAYDPTLTGITVAWSRAAAFCLETTDRTHHLASSDFKAVAGKCSATAG